jgi:hypothetical protein
MVLVVESSICLVNARGDLEAGTAVACMSSGRARRLQM